MFQRIQQYDLLAAGGQWYRPRAYGEPHHAGWSGWLVFFPITRDAPLSPPDPEVSGVTFDALTVWAGSLTVEDLERGLVRARTVSRECAVIDRLAAAEYEALEDAERLESAADIERIAARVDEAAATAAREDAQRLRRERLTAEESLAQTEEAVARAEAHVHDRAARDARTVAADAARRQGSLRRQAAPKTRAAKRSQKKR